MIEPKMRPTQLYGKIGNIQFLPLEEGDNLRFQCMGCGTVMVMDEDEMFTCIYAKWEAHKERCQRFKE